LSVTTSPDESPETSTEGAAAAGASVAVEPSAGTSVAVEPSSGASVGAGASVAAAGASVGAGVAASGEQAMATKAPTMIMAGHLRPGRVSASMLSLLG